MTTPTIWRIYFIIASLVLATFAGAADNAGDLANETLLANDTAAHSTAPAQTTTAEELFTPKPAEFPAGCTAEGFAYAGKLLVLKPKNEQGGPTVYLFQNTQKNVLVLNRFQQANFSAGASAGFASWLHSGKWSAFSLNQPDFSLSCWSRAPNYAAFVPCQDVLKVCSFSKLAQTNTDNQLTGGSYWIAEDKDLATILGAVEQRE